MEYLSSNGLNALSVYIKRIVQSYFLQDSFQFLILTQQTDASQKYENA